jgi:hypothetical protein
MHACIRYLGFIVISLSGCSDKSSKKASSSLDAIACYYVDRFDRNHQTEWQVNVSSDVNQEQEQAFVAVLKARGLRNVAVDHSKSVVDVPRTVRIIIRSIQADSDKCSVEIDTIYGPRNGVSERLFFRNLRDEWLFLERTLIGQM